MADERPELIHGQEPGSLEELRTARALEKYGWNYDYQVSYFGGRRIAGGIVLDFLVFTVPLPTPVPVYGSYWHGSRQAERDKLQELLLQASFHNQLAPMISFTEDMVDTQELADASVLKHFGRAN
jgi:hypothetical protein